jgi:methionyl-tRNA formyltransferase
MSSAKISLVFFGTGPVSRMTLDGIGDSFIIEAVITKPQMTSPSGRPLTHPILEWAEDNEVPAYTVANKAELGELFERAKFRSRVGLVVDFGIIIPTAVIESFEFGIVNSHFSLLPLGRGADPITAAILSGQAETGVSLMTIVPALDEGPILTIEPLTISVEETGIELTDRLVALSNKLIQSTLPKYLNGSIKPYTQDINIEPTYTKKLTKSQGDVMWDKSAAEISREVRAFWGWPGSRTRLFDRDVIITKARIFDESTTLEPGEVARDTKRLIVGCGQNSALEILTLKPVGKKEMSAKAFLNGQSI